MRERERERAVPRSLTSTETIILRPRVGIFSLAISLKTNVFMFMKMNSTQMLR